MVHRRYSDFQALEDAIQSSEVQGMTTRLPKRRFWGNYDSQFLERRRTDLEAYLQALLAHDVLCEDTFVLDFLGARTNMGASYDSFGFAMRSGKYKVKAHRNSEIRDDMECHSVCSVM